MKLPKVVERFIETQNSYDSKSYTECFTESAIVHDEGKVHRGKEEIRRWIEHSNEAYQSSMELVDYEQAGSNGVLTANVSGTFPGSPIVLKFHMELKDELIDSLKVTG
ncbi:nuclear transport factor 2 family protein [Pedobacter deserti]|uniref:nuclear transport factor 2 family protein n=1 Tax=Pedobacter deserti TaxID=2817382 RepID=UPI00210D33BE|nr:nuclear transport factor 2 family protein [Pedobacter sp. SYSU D00382]